MLRKISFRFGVILIVAILFLFPNLQIVAQHAYPDRPIEIVVPWPPGASVDLGIRFFSDKWAEFLGQPVVVVNKPGASGAIGTKYVVYSKPEGYTLLGTSDTVLITNRLERKDIGYDLDSFRLLFNYSKILVYYSVKSDSRWKNLSNFIKEAKNNPGKLKYATWGPSSVPAMAAEMLAKAAGVRLTFVPFKSGPDSLAAVAGGNVDMAVTLSMPGLGRSGMIRCLAISDLERVPSFPDVPTLRELGYPIKFSSQPIGLAVPIKTPENVISKFIEAHSRVRDKYAKEIMERLPKVDLYPLFIDGKTGMEELKEREKLYKEYYTEMGLKFE